MIGAELRVSALYTSLEEANAELHRRRTDKALCRAVAEFHWTHAPDFLDQEPRAMLARAVFSADFEFERFLALSKVCGMPPLCLEFSSDRFVSFNKEKCRRAKMTFPWINHTRALRVVDIPKHDWQPFHRVPTVSGLGLVDFHYRLLKMTHPHFNGNLRDVSRWAEALGGKPLPYLHWIALAVTDGVLFENFFETDPKERQFLEERVFPAFARAIELFGVKPLIVRLFTPEEERTPICWQYPSELYPIACDLLNGSAGNHSSNREGEAPAEPTFRDK